MNVRLWNVQQLLRGNAWPKDVELWLCPCLNPTGFPLNRRENVDGVDLNRDYLHLQSDEVRAHTAWLKTLPRFDVALCLHEDWESHGFYLYELNPDRRPTLADAMITAAQHHGPIETADMIDGRAAAAPGIIRPESDPLLRDLWPEAIYLLRHHCRLGYTLETPSCAPLDQRIATHAAAVRAALAMFRQ